MTEYEKDFVLAARSSKPVIREIFYGTTKVNENSRYAERPFYEYKYELMNL